jgi:alanyl-tRNA synthetase
MITREELLKKYRDYFKSKGHNWISGASLVPENDPTVLFTTAGMHPLVPYLMGEPHAEGKRLANVQKCIRTGDIDEVGDAIHHTFFEMLGFWSLGDYSKEKSIPYTWELFTDVFGINKDRLAVSVFIGDENAPFDEESYNIWLGLGVSADRIAKLPKSENWWGPAGTTGPCGPDSEIFYWIGKEEPPKVFDSENKLWSEIGNNVFMQYNKTADGKYETLKQQNVDTGIGLARVLAILNGLDDNYQTELYKPFIDKIEEITNNKYEDNVKEFRIIADHLVAATFALSDGVVPANKGIGYIVRRLIRRSLTSLFLITNSESNSTLGKLYPKIVKIYGDDYPQLKDKKVLAAILEEEDKYSLMFYEAIKMIGSNTSPKQLFNLYQSHGLYLQIAFEVMEKRLGYKLSENEKNHYRDEFKKLLIEHQDLSRTASAGMFKGGLADAGEVTTKYHTATHLLQEALREVLGDHVSQKGSNITPERTRFDFSHPEKMTEDQIKKVEDLVNGWIKEDLPVTMEEMTVVEAKKAGAMGVFEDKYGSKVKVYSIGANNPSAGSMSSPQAGLGSRDFVSREICGGPHVTHTGEIGGIKIVKEEASSAGVRRIKAVLI